MTDFDEKLKAVIQRGHQSSSARRLQQRQQQMSDDEIKRRHNDYRLHLSDRIENCLKSLAHQVPGFEYEIVYGDKGWGGAVRRDEVVMNQGSRSSEYSRLEITIRPLSELKVVNMVAKGTVRNKEILSRQFHREIEDAEESEFLELIDRWVLEYAQLYSGK